MIQHVARFSLLWGCIGWCALGAIAERTPAEEPATQFLTALRERGYYDMALKYLDQVENNDLVNVEFQAMVPYERGMTLIAYSRTQGDMSVRGKNLDAAQAALNEFITKQATNELVPSAKGQLANLLVERARMNIDISKRKNTAAAEATRLLTESRKMFDDAKTVFTNLQVEVKDILENKLPKNIDPNGPQKRLIPIRDQYRTDYLQARLLLPAINEEKADTYEESSEDRKKLLQSAAAEYKLVYEDYRLRIAGLYARMYQGRCNTKLKDYKEALSLFGELLDQPDQPEAFRSLKKKTLMLCIDCWFGDSGKPLYNDAILRLGKLIEGVRPNEAKEPEWMYLRLSLARAYKAQADDLPKGREQTSAFASAKKHATFVSRAEGDYKREAQEFLAALRGVDLAPEEKPKPTTFAQARQAGKEALDAWQTAQQRVANLKGRIASEKDPKEKAAFEEKLKQAEKDFQEGPTNSLEYFRLALELADADTPSNDINVVRYFMAFWYFTLEQYHDAAIVGEFVARRDSNAPGASQCGQIAMAAYVRLYKLNKTNDKSFEIRKIASIGDYIIEVWPNKPEAVVAANTLIAFMVNDNKADKALEYLQRIPADSPGRGAAELSTGQALWSSYLLGMNAIREKNLPDGVTEAQEKQRLEKVKEQAKTILSAGIERMKAKELSDTLLTAALSLCQIHVDISEAEKAVTLLEDPNVGPLTLVKQKSAATQRPGFDVETYKTALRAYIGSLKPGGDDSDAIGKAKGIMASLNQTMGTSDAGKQKLIATYVSLANDIKQQFDIMENVEQKKTMAKGFASFLVEVSKGADELNVLTWAAESFSKLGETFDTNPKALTADAKTYYTEAVKGFQRIVDKSKMQPKWLPEDVRIQVLMRMATTKRYLGDYQEAMKLFVEILQEKNSMLNVQVEAAKTYQEMGRKAKKDSQSTGFYGLAITGYYKDTREKIGNEPNKNYNKNTVWGWGKLAKVTASYDQFRDVFHESRLNTSRCLLERSKRNKSDSDKDKARIVITSTQQLYPDLGGAQRWKQYDKLMKEITGEGLKKEDEAAPKATR